jgi:hypothetical protein
MTVSAADLDTFCAAVDAKIRAHYEKAGMTVCLSMLKPTTHESGPKYARIVRNETASRAVFCFVDLATGTILKAAGWKAPTKQNRGNIANGAADVTPYGAQYLR